MKRHGCEVVHIATAFLGRFERLLTRLDDLQLVGDRTFKLGSGRASGYGRYAKFLSGGPRRGDFKLGAPHGGCCSLEWLRGPFAGRAVGARGPSGHRGPIRGDLEGLRGDSASLLHAPMTVA